MSQTLTEHDPFLIYKVGDSVALTHLISAKDVTDFVALTGDTNPLHVDHEYARETSFQKPVVHGMLSASFISTLIGTKIPGKGALWMSQTLEFLRPTRVGDLLNVRATVTHKSEAQRILKLAITIVNQDGVELINGESTVKVLQMRKRDVSMQGSQNRLAIVTGGSQGIGAAISLALAKDGFSVLINYLNSESMAQATANEIEEQGGRALIFKGDVRNADDMQAMVEFGTSRFGPVAVLVNNAGGAIVNNSFSELKWEDVQKQFDVHVKGAFNAIKAVLPSFTSLKSGKIINISSIYVDDTPPQLTYDYIMAKAALSSMSKSLAVEYGPHGIQVNLVAPGMTSTQMIANLPEKTKLLTERQSPLRRLAQPEDIANVVAFLASDRCSYLTGETIRVCGGQRML